VVAASAGAHVEAVAAILKAGADPNRATRTGNTALRTAITLGDGDTIAALLEGGRGLHSSTSHLNLSRFWTQKLQQPSTSQLNLRRFCRCDL